VILKAAYRGSLPTTAYGFAEPDAFTKQIHQKQSLARRASEGRTSWARFARPLTIAAAPAP